MAIKKKLLFSASAFLMLSCIIAVPMCRSLYHEKLNQNLVHAINQNDTSSAITALQAGAESNALGTLDEDSIFYEDISRLINRMFHREQQNQKKHFVTTLVLLFRAHRTSDSPVEFGVENFDVLKALLIHGADVNATDEKGNSPLIQAAQWNFTDSIHLLIHYGANVKRANRNGQTALHWAALNGNTEAVRELIAQGADVNADSEVGSPIISAALYNHPEIIRILLDNHAEVNRRTRIGSCLTALDYAKEMNNSECIDILKNAGAK